MKTLKIVTFLLFVCFCPALQAQTYPFNDSNLPVEKRASDLVSRLTLEEKVAQMLNKAPGIDRLGIPPYDWWNECLHGVARTEYAVTVYPQAIAMAAGWDVAAMQTMGDYTAVEGRAIYNMASAKGDYRIYHGLTFWTPNINIFRDPRWGRGQETYGEDPFLTGSLGKGFVHGLQGNDPTYLKAAACAKHFAVHSGPEWCRHTFNTTVSSYDLWDTYLPAFRDLVVDANVAGVMCAYNAYDGQPCCCSDKLMVDILRTDWNFNGYVTSDCGAIDDFYKTHKTHPDAPAAAADAVFHGTDVDCGAEAYLGLVQAVKDGKITEAQVDASLKRLFITRMRLGMLDPKDKVPFSEIDSTVLASAPHKAHTLKMAQQSIVLLKNDGTLPLNKSKLKKIAILGPNADNVKTPLGNYSGTPLETITPLAGLMAKLGNDVEIIYERACNYADMEVIDDLDLSQHIVSPNGFTVEFFDNYNWKGKPVYKGTRKTINFNSNNSRGTEQFAASLPKDNFSSRFVGTFEAPTTGRFDFGITSDDGYRFYIDGKLVSESDGWTSGNPIFYQLNAKKGQKYQLKFEHHQKSGGAEAKLGLYSVRQGSAKEVLAKVKDVDAIVFVGGISPQLEGEEMDVRIPGFKGGDRTSILLPAAQTEMLKALKTTGKPVVFVMMSGSAIATPWEAQNVNAIVEAWYGGEQAGTALADVLLGDYNPSGHLPVTFYEKDTDLPDFLDYNMANRTYKYFTGKALYPFGHGLSYTTFAYKWAMKPQKAYKANGTITASVAVKNTGKLAGDVVGQVYVKYPTGKNLPLKELRTFARKTLAEGGSTTINIAIPVAQLAKWDDASGKLVVPTGTYTIFVGSSSEDEAVKAEFEVK